MLANYTYHSYNRSAASHPYLDTTVAKPLSPFGLAPSAGSGIRCTSQIIVLGKFSTHTHTLPSPPTPPTPVHRRVLPLGGILGVFWGCVSARSLVAFPAYVLPINGVLLLHGWGCASLMGRLVSPVDTCGVLQKTLHVELAAQGRQGMER